MQLSELLNYILGGTNIATIILGWRTRKTDAVDKMADVYKKMSEQTEKRLNEMQKTLDEYRTELNQYYNQCSKCSNNKLRK